MSDSRPCHVLMVYPKFLADTFWDFADPCKVMGARYPASPLGLITVAALLPRNWEIKLVDRNTEELTDADLNWADVVMTGGMLPQQADTLTLIDTCHRFHKPVVVGGPDTTSSPHVYYSADFQVLGEAEGILGEFITAWERGDRMGTFTAPKFDTDVTKNPIPRFDLLKFDHYLSVGVQFSRGCPFNCEFCDIIELYGRVPRAKSSPQVLAELEALYALGYRGQVDFVDDNLIGNKKALKLFLPELKDWQIPRNYPFEFSTEASVNLADDETLLQMMREANFCGIFVGIESPDPATLVSMRKKQNTRRNLVESIHKIYAAGLFVTAGFILGFDNEKASVSDGIVEFIEEAAIPVCMVGLLYALPNTQLTRRLASEGRLHPHHEIAPVNGGDQCTTGLNFDTKRPPQAVLLDYKHVLERIYSPTAYAQRLERFALLLDRSRSRHNLPDGDRRTRLSMLDLMRHFANALPEAREPFWRALAVCGRNNSAATRILASFMVLYLHLGPFSGRVIKAIDRRIALLDSNVLASEAFQTQPVER